MRIKQQEQLNLFHIFGKSEIAKELSAISLILDANPKVLDLVYSDLTKDCRVDTGTVGMTAEQVLRVGLLKQYRQLDFRELAFHLEPVLKLWEQFFEPDLISKHSLMFRI